MDPLPEVEMIPHDISGLHILQLEVNVGHYTPYYYVGDGQRISFVRVGDESLPATATAIPYFFFGLRRAQPSSVKSGSLPRKNCRQSPLSSCFS